MTMIFLSTKKSFLRKILFSAFAMLSAAFFDSSFACGVDQKMETWNGGTSERNLPGYFEWQSFTAGVTGGLCQIDLMFCNSNNILNGTGTLNIYEGTGVAGKLLNMQIVTVDGRAYPQNKPFWQPWPLSKVLQLRQGSVYTFQFIPKQSGGLPDPYLIQVNTNDLYPGGRNSQMATWDNPFRTYTDALILPVEMLYFRANEENGKVNLSWAASSEINHLSFTVVRSNADNSFSSLGVIISKAGVDRSSYTYTDNAPAKGRNLYRLKQTDKDGTVTYSQVVSVSVNNANSSIRIYPNPVKDVLHINGLQPGSIINIIDASGVVFSAATVTCEQYDGTVQSLKPGLYFIHIKMSSTIKTVSFIKQ